METEDFVVYDYSVKNTKTGEEAFGTARLNVALEPDVSFDDLRPIMLRKAAEDDSRFANSDDVEITLLDTLFEAGSSD